VKYYRDDVKRRLISTISGGLNDGDAVKRMERQAADGAWAYASLIDMRGVTTWLSFEQMAGVTRCARAIAAALGPRGPVAIVVANQALIPVGQTHVVIRHETGTVAFFRDLERAEEWLEIEQSQGHTPGRSRLS
jgi:hypothetical protein